MQPALLHLADGGAGIDQQQQQLNCMLVAAWLCVCSVAADVAWQVGYGGLSNEVVAQNLRKTIPGCKQPLAECCMEVVWGSGQQQPHQQVRISGSSMVAFSED